MNISKKWRAAAAGAIALALVAGGAVSANAAEGDIVNPQPNGSPGGFYLFDGTPTLETPGRVYDRAEFIMAAADDVDFLAEVMPADYAAPGSWDTVYKFLAKTSELNGGTGSWRAWAQDAAAGPNGGVLTPNLTLGDFTSGNNGGIESVFTEGGEWQLGLAFTTNAGVTPVGMVYRTVTVNAATDTFTVTPLVVEGPAPIEPVVEADLTAGLQNAGLVTETADSKTLAIAGGAALAGQTLAVGSFPAGLTGNVTLDASGNGTVNAAAVNYGQATKLYLAQSDNTVVAWDSFTLTQTQSTQDTTALEVEVTSSGKFSLVAPAAQTIDLGDVRRNRISAPVALGAVTVFDDRDVLTGWNLNISSTAFTGPGATTVAAGALGYAPVGTTLFDGITAGVAKLAGEGTFGVLAEGAAGSATGEFEGAVIDTNLTFKAPINAAKGVHTATLTLDLVSK